MSAQNEKQGEFVRIDLTDSQKDAVQEKTGKPVDAIELTVEELEERIAPRKAYL